MAAGIALAVKEWKNPNRRTCRVAALSGPARDRHVPEHQRATLVANKSKATGKATVSKNVSKGVLKV